MIDKISKSIRPITYGWHKEVIQGQKQKTGCQSIWHKKFLQKSNLRPQKSGNHQGKGNKPCIDNDFPAEIHDLLLSIQYRINYMQN